MVVKVKAKLAKKDETHLKPDAVALLDYLRMGGGATVREAQDALGMTEVRSRISELIKAGVPIRKKWESGQNKFGKPVRFVRYSVADDAP